MKNQSIFSILYKALAITAVISIASCDDEEDDHHDARAVITLATPVANATYTLGDPLHITGSAVGETELHGYDIYILLSGDTVFQAAKHDHDDTLNIHEHWDPIDTTGDMVLHVVVTLDHDNNTETKTVAFHCIP